MLLHDHDQACHTPSISFKFLKSLCNSGCNSIKFDGKMKEFDGMPCRIPVHDSSNSQRAAVRKWEQKCDLKGAVCSYWSASCALSLILVHVGAMVIFKCVVPV